MELSISMRGHSSLRSRRLLTEATRFSSKSVHHPEKSPLRVVCASAASRRAHRTCLDTVANRSHSRSCRGSSCHTPSQSEANPPRGPRRRGFDPRPAVDLWSMPNISLCRSGLSISHGTNRLYLEGIISLPNFLSPLSLCPKLHFGRALPFRAV